MTHSLPNPAHLPIRPASRALLVWLAWTRYLTTFQLLMYAPCSQPCYPTTSRPHLTNPAPGQSLRITFDLTILSIRIAPSQKLHTFGDKIYKTILSLLPCQIPSNTQFLPSPSLPPPAISMAGNIRAIGVHVIINAASPSIAQEFSNPRKFCHVENEPCQTDPGC